MPHFALYAHPEPEVAARIEALRRQVAAQPGVTVPTEAPHFTVLYGPEWAPGTPEIPDSVDDIYPGARQCRPNDSPTTFRGVSHFLRSDHVFIFLEFRNDTLTELQCALRAHWPEVNQAYLRAHATDGDHSRAACPRRWLHVTIATLDPHTSTPADWVRVEDAVREAAADFPSTVRIAGLSLVSAVTDTLVPVK